VLDWSNEKNCEASEVLANLKVMRALPVSFHIIPVSINLCWVKVSVRNYSLLEVLLVFKLSSPISNCIEFSSDTNTGILNFLSNLEGGKHELYASLSVVVPTTSDVHFNCIDKVIGDFDCTGIAILNDFQVALADHSVGEAGDDFSDDQIGDLFTVDKDSIRVDVRSRAQESNANVSEFISSGEILARIHVIPIIFNISHDFLTVSDHIYFSCLDKFSGFSPKLPPVSHKLKIVFEALAGLNSVVKASSEFLQLPVGTQEIFVFDIVDESFGNCPEIL